ncbi:PREDICTED: serine/threonine-protein phosphatase 2A activator-like [Amphimedon queenslandica]|uniref:Serine/threonine-protein phosphatase 2A activator n=1 Tax=Amphimedon queenslandica TaxID=400682 RepID=A0A1X7VCL9_AMPQE|nr:PREDICTED: serine/threonine-protein phosphatase 2A activator-like [Amphimedon queenslandica]|eukprot:XP_011402667.1 PREDICTED: serine/threonine-protein phosphatase 2A activator-like [Amphimedon queenslandica]
MASDHVFKRPERLIKNEASMDKWLNSEAYSNFIGWIKILSESVRGKTVSSAPPGSEATKKVLSVLDQLSVWVDEIPAVDQPQRFGNIAFRSWLDKVKANARQLIESILPEDLKGAAVELEVYFLEGFGNYTRIDYGTGHEAKFMAFLCCLMQIRAIPLEDKEAVVLRIAVKYLDLMRKIQKVYRLEPAGSHGVWGLDDYQFIPFIWGAAQLIGLEDLLHPRQIPDPIVADKNKEDYIFMSCLNYIHEVKKGVFAEHSNVLWGISSLSEWNRVHSGLLKMYKGEVLDKFPVAQHFPFGTILSIEPATTK